MQCEVTTKSGDQCKNDASEGERYCYAHAPEDEQTSERESSTAPVTNHRHANRAVVR